MSYKFPITFWSNHSTRVQFKPFTKLPGNASVTSCMVFATKNDTVLLARPGRGWGLPGGHKELDEAPEVCAIREVAEETGVTIGNLKLIGGWKAQKIAQTEANSRYPDTAYQLLFLADVLRMDKFDSSHESMERKFVRFDSIKQYHHEYEQFSPILAYVLSLIERTNA